MQFTELPRIATIDHPLECLEKQEPGASSGILPIEDQEEETARDAVIICRQCRNHITDESRRFSIDGKHIHTFANPRGNVYDIACFNSVVGCYRAGHPSDEFTWFKGYSWQVVICTGCMTHLGWYFTSSGEHRFFGLIVDRLASLF